MSAVLASVPSEPRPGPIALPMPKHFRTKRLKAAWEDLIEGTEAALHVRENRFTFEMAATLLARFRAGDKLSVSDSKDLKRLMVTLGLAKRDDDGGKPKGKPNAHYFDQ